MCFSLKDVEKPTPTDNEVLIKVQAASVNAADWHLMRADPFLARFETGLLKPKNTILGADIAGRVEAVGRNVTQFQAGDEVFGDSYSACGWAALPSMYVSVKMPLALKPANYDIRASRRRPGSRLHRFARSSRQRTDSIRAKGFD